MLVILVLFDLAGMLVVDFWINLHIAVICVVLRVSQKLFMYGLEPVALY